MIHRSSRRRSLIVAAVALGLAPVVVCAPAWAATVIDGPIDLATAESYGVLGSTTVTNTGPSVIAGDLGVSPGDAVTGFEPEMISGATHAGDEAAALARDHLTAAFGVASSLTPTDPTLYDDLDGLTLTPGVYAGGELSLSGTLTLAGDADSVWVFQAASTLVTASGSDIQLTGGASSCNVFWRVGTSATLGGGSDFVGTILADVSITTVTGTDVAGRLLARSGAVTLGATTVTVPTGCADASGSTVTTSPTITSSAPTDAALGEPYRFEVEADGSPDIVYTITDGALPPGLELDADTGVISGTPTETGVFDVTITASNGTDPDDSASYQILVEALLAESGSEATLPLVLAVVLVLGGVTLVASRRRAGQRRLTP